MSEYSNEKYTQDKIKAIDAKTEAQKIAFSPLTFQAVRAALELGILKVISDSQEKGITIKEIAKKVNISCYGVKVLLEINLSMNIVKVLSKDGEDFFYLGKTGCFLLEDEMTRVNFNFVNDVCYKGAFELTRSIKEGKPLGLEVFGYSDKTIYEALSTLPERVKKSWFEFDHFYSDIGFREALPIVFKNKPKKIIDIGGNTAKWAILCCNYNPDVEVIIVDLPGQIEIAEKEIAKNNLSRRIKTYECNILSEDAQIPNDADIIWMSQFLDCFSLDEVTRIMKKTGKASNDTTEIFIFEPFWDKQKYDAASFSLQATSLYFTCMANGNSKMYNSAEFEKTIKEAGFYITEALHNLGSNSYSLLRCRKSSEIPRGFS
ncbi:MAG: class I SAM-dependent methyltransferase [Treponema sp.]|jgi:ubiquinone/menaquinone biosynthesis C-methylase UbiE|nr:class I SAM-dependent methyltransferase [Treponema sp.]